jgi:dienelactone hydrolase
MNPTNASAHWQFFLRILRAPFLAVISATLIGSNAFAQEQYTEPRLVPADQQQPLAGTHKLTLEGDIASQMIDGVDRFLLRKLDESLVKRAHHWKRDFSSPEAYAKSIEPNRKRLTHILGIRDPRRQFFVPVPEIYSWAGLPREPLEHGEIQVYAVRWQAFGDVEGRGVLLTPQGREPIADLILIPDINSSASNRIFNDKDGGRTAYARHLAASGCRVLMPELTPRIPADKKRTKINQRELLYRSSFELGRGLIGYEVQKILAAVDWFDRERTAAKQPSRKIGVAGWGDAGMLGLYAAAVDPRIDVALVSGYFDNRQNLWQEPIDRNVFGLLDQFGDAELASLIAPRRLIVEAAGGPTYDDDGKSGSAPARLRPPKLDSVKMEVERARKLVEKLAGDSIDLVVSDDGLPGSDAALKRLLKNLAPAARLQKADADPVRKWEGLNAGQLAYEGTHNFHELDRHNQQLLIESPYVRAEFMKKLDTSSVEAFEKSAEWYREYFATEVIGRFDDPLLPAHPRSRKAYETDKWTGYEVTLDVFPDVFAYGLLLLPKDLKDGERRPVVVCQHGLEGRPQDTIGPKGSEYYSAFAARLAERGFITFAPQNIYIFHDRFRTLQRKAYPLGKTLFSIMVPQHQQITDWLKTLTFVDGERIAFYGLSYGGKSAMRIPPLVKNYCLSICSADFNEWVWKNASSRSPYSYADKGEYEIFEFDLGSTFNYAEMAALIAPRPFMVERGHFDNVAPDETVAYEFAKVRHLYNARLKLPPDRCQIEFFVGPHKINGVGTFAFLHHHLKWPVPESRTDR